VTPNDTSVSPVYRLSSSPQAPTTNVLSVIPVGREAGERVGRLWREPGLVHPVALGRRRRSRPREDPGERRRSGEAGKRLLPVLARRGRVLAGEPSDVLAIGAWRRRQVDVAARDERVVDVEGFAQHDACGPAVEQRVMVGQQLDPVPLAETEQREPQQRRRVRVEVAMAILGDVRVQPALLLVRAARRSATCHARQASRGRSDRLPLPSSRNDVRSIACRPTTCRHARSSNAASTRSRIAQSFCWT
jgi:hypothetical protein